MVCFSFEARVVTTHEDANGPVKAVVFDKKSWVFVCAAPGTAAQIIRHLRDLFKIGQNFVRLVILAAELPNMYIFPNTVSRIASPRDDRLYFSGLHLVGTM